MKLFHIIPILLLLFHLQGYSQWINTGARHSAMGLASVSASDMWSVNNNQAGMAFYKQPAAGVYSETRFLLKELGNHAVGITLPNRFGVFGVSMNYTGDHLYSRTKGGLAYARTFGNRVAFGLQLDYLHTHIAEDYGNRGNVTFETGILIKITDDLVLGTHVFNPVQAKLARYNDERLPAIIRTGLGYSFSEKLLVQAEASMNSDKPLDIGFGAEYNFSQGFYARAGARSNPFMYTFGFGMAIKNLTLDLSSSVHEKLGYSPQLSLQYSFLQK